MGWRLLDEVEGGSRKKTEQTEHEIEHEAPPEVKEICSLQGRNHMRRQGSMSIQSWFKEPF